MKLSLTVVKMTVENDRVVYKFEPSLQEPLEKNEVSGEIFISATPENSQFVIGDSIVADLSEEEDIIEVTLEQ